jgi:hypothetical protein
MPTIGADDPEKSTEPDERQPDAANQSGISESVTPRSEAPHSGNAVSLSEPSESFTRFLFEVFTLAARRSNSRGRAPLRAVVPSSAACALDSALPFLDIVQRM